MTFTKNIFYQIFQPEIDRASAGGDAGDRGEHGLASTGVFRRMSYLTDSVGF
jgi:hypothetical protein